MDTLDKKIDAALKISSKKLLEQKKKLGQKMAISENGKIKIIDFSKKEKE